jgi:hypothetical protein
MTIVFEIALVGAFASHYLFPGYDARPIVLVVGIAWVAIRLSDWSRKKKKSHDPT